MTSKLKELLENRDYAETEQRVMAEVGTMAHAAIERLMLALDTEALQLASTGMMALPAAHELLTATLVGMMKERQPGLLLDGRAVRWRTRIRLFKGDAPEPEADTDPDLDADKAGTMEIAGLPGVAHELARTAREFHGANCPGLDMDTLRHRLKSLRPTLSRRGGDAVWRVPYQAPQGGDWLARVDVARV